MSLEPDQIETVSDYLIRVPLITPTLPPATRTNTFVVLEESGFWILDPGSPDQEELARLEELVRKLPGEFLGYVVTHYHRDHWGGLPSLLARKPGPVVCHSPELIDLDATFWTPARFHSVSDRFELVGTPGHTDDHLVLFTPDRDVLAGDMVAGVGTVVIDPPSGHMASYFFTLEDVLDSEPNRLFPAHGPTVEDGVGKLNEYMSHRKMRERQVVQGLTELGGATPFDLVPAIYAEVPEFLHPIAARSVLAHLIKLVEEERVLERSGTFRLASGETP